MAISKKSVTVVTDNNAAAAISVVTSETPTATAIGDLVVVITANDFYTASVLTTPTATGSPTMNPITNGAADAGSNLAHIKSYWYVANTAGAQTVTMTEGGIHDEERSVAAIVLGGADTSTAIDVAANGTGASSTSQVAPSVSPTSSDAYLVVQVSAGGGGGAASYTTPSPLGEDTEFRITSIYSGVLATAQLAASGATGTFTFTAGSATSYGAVTIAVKTAGGGTNATVTLLPVQADVTIHP